ncbi:MAG: hypothetical protein Q9170_004951 [Blastenia crenularia]
MKRDAETDPVSPPPTKRKIESATTKKAVAGFFTPASKKEPDQITWRIINGTLLSGAYKPNPSKDPSSPAIKRRKIAAFDFDSTLISPSASGNIIAKYGNDWKWWHTSVPATLRQLHAEGYEQMYVAQRSNRTKPVIQILGSDSK